MDLINKYVITLVSTIVFMTAIELIAPNSSMKKYLKFILGLMLIATILNPILVFLKGGETSITEGIQYYEDKLFQDDGTLKSGVDEGETKRRSFINNFNQSCTLLLKKEFKDMEFESSVDCSINFNDVDFNINKLTINIKKSKIKKIDKIQINDSENQKEDDDTQKKIKAFVSEELDIPKDKIEVNY